MQRRDVVWCGVRAEGGTGSDRWVFPPPIYDEAEYRMRVRREEEAQNQHQNQQEVEVAADASGARLGKGADTTTGVALEPLPGVASEAGLVTTVAAVFAVGIRVAAADVDSAAPAEAKER